MSGIGYRSCYSWTRGAGCHQDGWGICSWGTSTKDPWYGWGVYKITYLDNGDYFYIDFRDDNYGVSGSDYGGIDLHVYYIEDHFEWFPDYDYENFQTISTGQLVRIWERKSKRERAEASVSDE